tara:strand:+ start:830 stop:1861 length:1032 start_codon:yes stop_codon:yes gene_type:complete
VKILIIGPTAFPYMDYRTYGGIEMLCGLFAQELSKHHTVAIASPPGTTLPPSVIKIDIPANWDSVKGEYNAIAYFQQHLKAVGIVLDFTHNHAAVRSFPDIPHISMIWHDPMIMKTATPDKNVAALSQWQASRFLESTGRPAKVLDAICADPDVFAYEEDSPISDRFVAIGIVDFRKGHLIAAEMCLEMGAPLDIVGPGHDKTYEMAIKTLLNEHPRNGVVYHSEVDHQTKLRLLKQSKGLLYPVNFPEGYGESHSMKMVEALMLGVPCVTWDQGAMMEVFEDHALVAPSIPSMTDVMVAWDTVVINKSRRLISATAHERWASDVVVEKWMPTIESVAGGETW